MGKVLADQPLQYTIDGHAVDLLAERKQGGLHFRMTEGMRCIKQHVKHNYSRLCCASVQFYEFLGFGWHGMSDQELSGF